MLRAKDLAVARGGRAVLAGLNFSVDAGRALVLRGANGSGKTTLLRTLAGLQPALEGEVEIAENSLAYGAHLDGIKANLTVRENLRFWAEIFGKSDIDDAIDAFDLAKISDRSAHLLSAGQKRRLGLARMLVTGADIWLLDEPTVSLDEASVGLFARAVQAHLAKGGAAVIATHVALGIASEALDVMPFRAKAEAFVSSFDAGFL